MTLEFTKLREANIARCEQAFRHNVREWSHDDWFIALAGEYGEMCNVVKKLRRVGNGTNRKKDPQTREECIAAIAEEIADCVIYLDLLMAHSDLPMYSPSRGPRLDEWPYKPTYASLQALCCDGHVLLSRLVSVCPRHRYSEFLNKLREIAKTLSIDLSAAVVEKFDKVSRQRGSRILLGPKKECEPTWSSPSIAPCRYFGCDPDGPYCAHPKSLAESSGHGCSVELMDRKGLCTHGKRGEYQLWEAARKQKSPT